MIFLIFARRSSAAGNTATQGHKRNLPVAFSWSSESSAGGLVGSRALFVMSGVSPWDGARGLGRRLLGEVIAYRPIRNLFKKNYWSHHETEKLREVQFDWESCFFLVSVF